MKTETLIKKFKKSNIPDIRPGDTVKIHQKVKDKDKEKIQTFQGLVIAKKHGEEMGATITVRRIVAGVGVEKIIPIHLSTIDKIEILKRSKVRRAKLYHLRGAKGKRARLKRKDFNQELGEEENTDTQKQAEPTQSEQKEESKS